MSKDNLFVIAGGWIFFKPAKSERTTKEHMDNLGRQLGALPLEMIQREIKQNDEVFVVFYDVKGGPAEAFLVIGPEDLLEIEKMLWDKRDWKLYYYAVPLDLMDEGLRTGQYKVRLERGKAHF